MHTLVKLLAGFVIPVAFATPVFAQTPAPAAAPADPLSLNASAGLALTAGNKDTSTLNLGYGLAYDPKTRNVVKSEGLFLRGKSDGELTADRLALNGRDEYKLWDGVFAFGQLQYLKDQFKDIDYLVAPTVGLGYRIADTARTNLSVDAGVGRVWEKPLEADVKASGALTFSEKLAQKLSATATLTQSLSALYKTDNFSDSLYAFSTVLAASITTRTQAKIEFLDTYKNLVAPELKKNDIALIVGLVFKR